MIRISVDDLQGILDSLKDSSLKSKCIYFSYIDPMYKDVKGGRVGSHCIAAKNDGNGWVLEFR